MDIRRLHLPDRPVPPDVSVGGVDKVTKIKSRPTPAQARILRALDENRGLFLGFTGRQGWWAGTGEGHVRRELGNPLASTIRRMEREGWIKPADADERSWYHTITEDGRQAIEGLSEADFVPPAPIMTSQEILEILEKDVFPAPFWLFVRELAVDDWKPSDRRIDAFAMRITSGHLPRSNKTDGISGGRLLTSWALEVKVTREDFLRELSEPRKRVPAMGLAHRFAFVAPVGVVQKGEVPEGCGLLEIDGSGRISIAVHADYAPPKQPDWRLVASIARAMLR